MDEEEIKKVKEILRESLSISVEFDRDYGDQTIVIKLWVDNDLVSETNAFLPTPKIGY